MSPILISRSPCDAPVKSPVRLFFITACFSTLLLALSSCSTAAGFGRDVRKVGNEIEEAAR